MTTDAAVAERVSVRTRVVEAAARLLQLHGPAAVTTRAVAEAAGTQPPAIYRLFGDKDGLLDAVAEHVLATYVAGKAAAVAGDDPTDPVADLRSGWDTHVAFGVANPMLFGLLHDPARAAGSPAAAAGLQVLHARVHRVAAAGRLRVAERRAVELLHAAGTGAVLALLELPSARRDTDLADAMWETVATTILLDAAPDAPADGVSTAATAVLLRSRLSSLTVLGDAERALLAEWLDRIAAATGEPTAT